MKILFISYQFPPLNVGGAQRPRYFVKYLKDFGIDPLLITLDPNDYGKIYENPKVDDSLIPPDNSAQTVYVNSEDLRASRPNRIRKFISIYFNIYGGSEGKFWRRHFHKEIENIFCSVNIEAIYITAPPFSILPLAVEVKKKFNIPLIVDMRDPWTLWVKSPYPNFISYILTKRRESQMLKHADSIIATSKQTIRDFQNLHKSLDKSLFCYIPNGYDNHINQQYLSYMPGEKIKIGYVGAFYYTPESRNAMMTPFWKKSGHKIFQYSPRKEDWLYRSPYFFFKAITYLLHNSPKLKDKIEIHFAGENHLWLTEMIQNAGLEKYVIHHGFLNYEDVVAFQKSCDFLLLTSSKVINGRDYSVAGKTFEYFAMQKPILAFVCEGEQKDILKNTGGAIIFNPDEPKVNANILLQAFANKLDLELNLEYLKTFNRKNLARQLAEVIKNHK